MAFVCLWGDCLVHGWGHCLAASLALGHWLGVPDLAHCLPSSCWARHLVGGMATGVVHHSPLASRLGPLAPALHLVEGA